MIPSAFLVLLLALTGNAQSLPSAVKLRLVIGVSRTLEFPQGFGNLRLADPGLFDYRRVLRGNGAMGLLLLPRQEGKTMLIVNDSGGNPRFRFQIKVDPRGAERSLASQKAQERASGLRIKEASLVVGVPYTIEFPGQFGPIYLTDPHILDFRRLARSDGKVALMLLPRRRGLTDVTVHDVVGQPIVKYYVRVAP